MKNLMLAGLCVFAAVSQADDEAKEWGGMVTVWPRNCGRFLFVNTQKRIPEPTLNKPIARLREDMHIDIRMISGEGELFDLKAVPSFLRDKGALGAIWIVDDPALPKAIAATEDSWGVVNISQLFADSPRSDVIEKRICKSIYRTFGNIHGASESMTMPGCVMMQAVGLSGLDALECANYSPEAFGKISNYLTKIGYKQVLVDTYYDACEQGWAPAPTNAVQKQIWDKVHALPKAPIKIKPETEKVRD